MIQLVRESLAAESVAAAGADPHHAGFNLASI